MYLNPKGEVKNKVKSIAMKLGIVKTEEDDYLDWKKYQTVLECVEKYQNID